MMRKKGAPALIPITEVPEGPTLAKKFDSLGIGTPPAADVAEWEVRPGGMLVQKRDPDSDPTGCPPPPQIRVRVKYGNASHEIHVSPQASFGELKKVLSARTGLHPQDQKVLYKDKERSSNAFLDTCGVKDRSKLVLVEDPAGQAKRFLEMRKNAKMEKAAKFVSQISLEVDRLGGQVSALEMIVSKGKKVAEKDVLSLTEQLMNLLVKLDGIIVDGDVKLQRGMQVRRVQKYVETLDALKIKNALPKDNSMVLQQQEQPKQFRSNQNQVSSQPPAVVTTRWESFDLLSSMPTTSSANPTTTAASITTTATHAPRLDWELF